MRTSLSTARVNRFGIQGYSGCSLVELGQWQWGIRFTYGLCLAIAILGIYLASSTILAALAILAFLGVILPYHPFDYLYNYGVRHWLKLQPIPPRTRQAKFACGVAAVWLTITIWLFGQGWNDLGRAWGAILVAVATLVVTTDICIPSMIYNLITYKNIRPSE